MAPIPVCGDSSVGGDSIIEFRDNSASKGVFSAAVSNSINHHFTASSITIVVTLEMDVLWVGLAAADIGCQVFMGGVEAIS